MAFPTAADIDEMREAELATRDSGRKTKSQILRLIFDTQQLHRDGVRYKVDALLEQVYAAVRDDVPDY